MWSHRKDKLTTLISTCRRRKIEREGALSAHQNYHFCQSLTPELLKEAVVDKKKCSKDFYMCQFESIHFDPAHILCSFFPFFVIKDNDMHLGNFNDFFKC